MHELADKLKDPTYVAPVGSTWVPKPGRDNSSREIKVTGHLEESDKLEVIRKRATGVRSKSTIKLSALLERYDRADRR
jgi:hypothetical protein